MRGPARAYLSTPAAEVVLYWTEQRFTFLPTQYRLYGRWFLQVKRPNQQYQSTEGESYKGNPETGKNTIHTQIQNSTRKKGYNTYNTQQVP